MIQTAVGGLSQTQSMLNRMRELSVQAANDALTQQDRSYIQVEINEIRDHIDLIGNSTQFNRRSLLNGDSAILWSSSDNNVKAIVNGGLRSIDQYGQKYSVDGNFKLTVETKVGQAQTQKSNVFAIKHDNTATSKTISTALGVDDVYATGSMPPGTYNISLASSDGEAAKFTGSYKIGEAADGSKANVEDVFTLNASDGLVDNASILFEVKTINRNTGTVTLRATADIMNQDGANSKQVIDNIVLANDGEEINLTEFFGPESLSIGLSGIEYIDDGAAFTVSVSAQSPVESAVGLDIEGTVDGAFYDKWSGAPFHNEELHYVLNGDHIAGKELRFTNFIINEKTGDISEGNVYLKTGAIFRDFGEAEEGTLAASLKTGFVSEAATGKTKLRDIDKFWDAQGNFLIDTPKEITFTQGDGKQAKAMLYADDTIADVVRKFNSAIATGLGQQNYVDDASNFVSFVEGQTAGAEAVAGTLVMRSVLTGKRGEITMSGNEELLKAFGMNTIQESVENRYGVTVRNAHDNSLIAERVEVAGNRLIGAIHKNVDIEFEPMLGVTAAWDDTMKNFKFTDSIGGRVSEVTIHLADNTTVIQTGAGEGEDVMINIGDMRSHALGLDGVNVMSLEDAMHSVAIIDKATDKVSMQMAKLGASQNRLEHHIGNLTDEMQALIEANSTIRDTDYAKEMVEFTKIKILMESNSAMLAQSNAIQSQSILNLMR
ncbi:MAG: flagellin, partial [Synergistaceae bacterium]|nr:flagellin [Synergistaceae bacterium]